MIIYQLFYFHYLHLRIMSICVARRNEKDIVCNLLNENPTSIQTHDQHLSDNQYNNFSCANVIIIIKKNSKGGMEFWDNLKFLVRRLTCTNVRIALLSLLISKLDFGLKGMWGDFFVCRLFTAESISIWFFLLRLNDYWFPQSQI